MNYIYGINAVAEALKARGRSFEWVGVLKERHDLRLQRLVEECRRNGVAVRFLGRPELDSMAGNNAHQGVVAITSGKRYNHLDDVVAAKRGQYSLVVVLDGIEDPHNLGAILRTADASGADGVVIPERRAAGVTATVTKASAGASEHLPKRRICGSSGWTSAERKVMTRSITTWTAPSCWARRGRACTTWSRKSAISWFPFPCWERCLH
jgi:23S rRNA (guanosine2251-2'-O)-methyltransferase